MKRRGMKAFLVSCAFWLLPGLAGGVVSAAFLSAHEYQEISRMAGAFEVEGTLSAALKRVQGTEENSKGGGSGRDEVPGKGNVSGKDDIPEKVGISEDENLAETGKAFMEKLGYRKYGRLTRNLPYTLLMNLLLFELAGCVVFFVRKKEEKYNEERIANLTEYLKAVDRGEAAVLMRHEDSFSHLEDEIYKTVAELACTKEKAVQDHEILADRIADIAHQLKTPLTSMSLMTELLEPDKKEEQEYLERLRHQVERLKGLVDRLLALAKLDSHTIRFQKEQIGVEELLLEAAEPLREQMDRRKIILKIVQAEDLQIEVDIQWTTEALLNVLKNCVEHTPDGGKIKISCTKNPLYTQWLIEDGGKGFSKKDLPHLFERFYKGEQGTKDSAGIGLALTKLILEAQNGQISAENTADGHARFCIKMYAS